MPSHFPTFFFFFVFGIYAWCSGAGHPRHHRIGVLILLWIIITLLSYPYLTYTSPTLHTLFYYMFCIGPDTGFYRPRRPSKDCGRKFPCRLHQTPKWGDSNMALRSLLSVTTITVRILHALLRCMTLS
ncbi:hypothetical protein BJX66DRAFT_86567 [Aspergillus keveii]|uniref:Uncharacterized protein n=1 Tax=Aspergillus keveii TaxID=714993 RepID=A0ABR4GEV2_9EURO